MNIYFIRHGETDWNRAGKLQGREDIPLNRQGRIQAQNCGRFLKSEDDHWRAVFSSPLIRARETADIIADILGLRAAAVDDGLMERDYGRASGMTAQEREQAWPDGSYAGMEDRDLLASRVYGAVLRCGGSFSSGNIIIVSHGSAINSVLAKVSNHTIGTGKTRLKNACINLLEYQDRKLRIVYHNRSVIPDGPTDL